MSFGKEAIAQQLSFPLVDAQRLLRIEKECEIDQRELQLRKDQDTIKDQRIANLEKELELAKQEILLKDKVIAIKDMEIAATRKALQDMQTVTDRALKLAEVSKPTSNWQLTGIVAVIATAIGIYLGSR